MKKTIHANGITMAYQIDGPEAAPGRSHEQ